MKIVGQPLRQNRVEKSGPPVQLTAGEPGLRFVHVVVTAVTVLFAAATSGAFGAKDTAKVVLRTQVVAELAAMLNEHGGLHLSHCTVSL